MSWLGIARAALESYVHDVQLESDPYARVVPGGVWVDPVTGDPTEGFTCLPREARVLAYYLLCAADEAEGKK